jgi:GNAT superfamily N-acetyltransferase
MDVRPARSISEISDAAKLMLGLVDANKNLYNDDLETIDEYYRGSWFFSSRPEIPKEYCPPHGDVLLAYLNDAPAGTVAIYRMDDQYCELKSMFVPSEHRRKGVAAVLCGAVIDLARSQGYRAVRLTTGERQIGARQLYGQLGFSLVTPWDFNPPEGYDYFELALS